MNFKDIKISSYNSIADARPTNVTLAEILAKYKSGEYETAVNKVRNAANDEQRRKAKSKLPAVTMSGVFNGAHSAGNLAAPSGIVCIDIDAKDNTDMDDPDALKDQLKNLPFVAYCAISSSGKGLFVLIPIKWPNKLKSHVLALFRYFAEFGINCDNNCTDVSRLRFATYDPEPYVNEDATTFDLLVHDLDQQRANVNGRLDAEAVETTIKTIKAIELLEQSKKDIAPDYENWLKLAFAFATTFGEVGRELYLRVCRLCPKHDEDATNAKYDEALKSGKGNVSIGTFLAMAKSSAADDFADIDFDDTDNYAGTDDPDDYI
jgi:hypothetical protein